MVKKTSETTASTLGVWIGRAPIKFALYALFLPIILMILYIVLAMAITRGASIPAWSMLTVGMIGGVIAVYKLVGWLRAAPLDRRSFVAIFTGGFIASRLVGILALFLFGFMFFPIMMAFSDPMVSPGFSLGMTLVMLILGLMGAYTLGVQLIKVYATYLRAIDMGVSRTKALLSLPFSMHWMPGYFLDGTTRVKKDSVTIRANGFRAMVDWIVA